MKKFLIYMSIFLSLFLAVSHRPDSQVSQTVGRASENNATPLSPLITASFKPLEDINEVVEVEVFIAEKVEEFHRYVAEQEALAQWHRDLAAAVEWHRALQEAVKAHQSQLAKAHGSAIVGTGTLARIAVCESGLNGVPRYHLDHYADRPHINSSASGAYGFLDGTWDMVDGVKGNGFKGYKRAFHAPPEIQDEAASILWNNGRGASHWNASRYCWG